MPNPSARKGSKFERELVNKALALGHPAHRNRMSRACQDESWDVTISGKLIECKSRRSPIKFIANNLKPGTDALAYRCNGGDWWVIMRGDDWLKLI